MTKAKSTRTLWAQAGRLLGAGLALAMVVHVGATAQIKWERVSSADGKIEVPNAGNQQTCTVAADFDGDGAVDFIVGERTQAPSVVLYRHKEGKWVRTVIDDTRLRPEAGGAVADITGNGFPDLVLGQDASGNEMWWWENPAPDFSKPWTRRIIKNSGANKHHDQSLADYTGDGKLDLVSWNQRAKQLLLFTIPDNPRTHEGEWPSKVIYTWDSGQELEGFPSIPMDINGNGKVDIVGGGRWFEHVGGTEFKAHVIDDEMRFTQTAVGQLVEGGRPEIVFSPGDMNGTAKWYQWVDDKWVGKELTYVQHGHTCEIRDIDGDGHQDIFIAEMGNPGAGDKARNMVWFGDGKGNFRMEVVYEGQGNHEGLVADFNGDGRLDILVKPYNHNAPKIEILLNQGKQ